MTRAALFDVDGTLVDSNDLHVDAWVRAFAHFGFDIPAAAVKRQVGKGGDNLIPALLPPDIVAAKQGAIETFRSDLFQRDYLPRVTAFPAVRPLFERLVADGIRIVLATSAKRSELDHHLSLLGVEDLIAGATSKDDVDRSKPCPDIFVAALARVAPIPAADAIVVGDSPWDVKAAAQAGLRTIGLRSGGFSDADLLSAGAVQLFDGAEDLLRRYDSSSLAGGRAPAILPSPAPPH